MTIKELIEKLQREEDQDRIVVLSSDSEGNTYSPLYGFWTGNYVAATSWCGRSYLEELTIEDIEVGYTEEDVKSGQKAIFLMPTN